MREAKDIRLVLEEIVDELPAESQARAFLLEAIDKMNAIFPLDPYHMEVMAEPAALIRKAYDLVDDDELKSKLYFLVLVNEHQARQAEALK